MNWFIFCYSSCVRIVSSKRSGMGKSLYIQRLAESLKQNLNRSSGVHHVTIPLHGPVITPDTVLEFFKDNMKNPTCCIYHIDIAPNVCLSRHWKMTKWCNTFFFPDLVESRYNSLLSLDPPWIERQPGAGVALPSQPTLCCGGHTSKQRKCSPSR